MAGTLQNGLGVLCTRRVRHAHGHISTRGSLVYTRTKRECGAGTGRQARWYNYGRHPGTYIHVYIHIYIYIYKIYIYIFTHVGMYISIYVRMYVKRVHGERAQCLEAN